MTRAGERIIRGLNQARRYKFRRDAADELYEALEGLLGQFDQAHDALGVERSASATNAIADARKALAKARGDLAEVVGGSK